jgi:hypothetical protein
MEHFELEGFIILKSSEESYHVIYDRPVSWAENMKILAWVSLLSHNEALTKYLQMQCIKKSSALRISPKLEKPSPKIVYKFGEQDKAIRNFLKFRALTKRILRQLRTKGEFLIDLPTP